MLPLDVGSGPGVSIKMLRGKQIMPQRGWPVRALIAP